MILKKPYAFLIRHFKLIHIILALPLIYIVSKTRLVVNFFNEYVANSYRFQTGSDISSLYVSGLMLFSIVVIILAALTIYFLLKYKEKPVKMYVFIIMYYVLLFAVLYWLSGIISSMSLDVLSAKAARSYRDIATIFYYPQYIFVGFVILRAVGFNIKQFNFGSDLKELEITSEDNEEVEVGFEIDGYKTKRFFRRFKREFGYYLIENKFMVTVVVIICIFSGIIVYYKTRTTYNSTYTQTDSFSHQGFRLKVKDSIISNMSYDGSKLDDGKYYLAIKVNIKNTMNKKSKFNYSELLLQVGDRKLKPIISKANYFIDYAIPYSNDFINPEDDKDYVFVYEIDKKDINKSFSIKVLSTFELKKDKLVTNYAIVNLSPVVITDVSVIRQAKINDKINFSNSNIGSTIFTVTDYTKGTSYIYDYKICKSENNCDEGKDIVSINYNIAKGSTSLLVIGYDLDLDKDSSYVSNLKSDKSFFTDFFKVGATVNGAYKEFDVIDITPKNLSNKRVLQVDGDILSTNHIDLDVIIRNRKYVINLS